MEFGIINIPSYFSDNLGILTSGVPHEVFWLFYMLVFMFFIGSFIVISYHLNHYALEKGGAIKAKLIYATVSIAALLLMFIALLQI